MKIALIGMPMVGKTTLAKKIATYYNLLHIDTDHYIEEKYNMSIQKLFAVYGEVHFRIIEREILKEILYSDIPSFILSCGGGLPCFHNNIKLLNKYTYTIYLEAPLSFFELQLQNDPQWENRPLFTESENPLQRIQYLLEKRKSFYEQAAYTQPVHLDIEQTYNELINHIHSKFI